MFHYKKGTALLLTGLLMTGAVVPAFAAKPKEGEDWFTHNQTAGSVSDMDINLKVQDRTTPIVFSAYVPAAVTIAISREGQVVTPENLRIINGVDTLPIMVWKIDIEADPKWEIVNWETNLKEAEYDSKKIALQLNGHDVGRRDFVLPWGIEPGGEIPLELSANIPYQTGAKDLEKVMTMGFTLDWADRGVIDNPIEKPHAKGQPMDFLKFRELCKDLTGTIRFEKRVYDGADGIPLGVNGSQDVILVIDGQNATLYGDGGIKCPEPIDEIGMFDGFQARRIEVMGLDTSEVTSMSDMFNRTKATAIVGLNALDTRNVTSVARMFQDSNAAYLNLSGMDTGKVTNMRYMFHRSKVKTLNLGSIKTVQAEVMGYMFAECDPAVVYCRSTEDMNKMKSSLSCDVNPSAFQLILS